jgi:hypothetical protein
MAEPMYLQGDSSALSMSAPQDNEQDIDCDCGHTQTVGVSEDYTHGVVYWWGEWTCDNCKETHSSEGEYEPSDDRED